ncbi:MAG: DUF2510 domain-containing protein [Actinomycetota bacterium]
MGHTTEASPGQVSTGAVTARVDDAGDASAEHMRQAPAGWYYDPADEAIYRFWDGERWTERLSDTVTTEIPRA